MRFNDALLKLAVASAPRVDLVQTNLLMHFDAASIVANDGDPVSTWANQATAFHASQGNALYQGTYVARSSMSGRPAVRMSGDDYMTLATGIARAAAAGFTLYYVADITQQSDNYANTILQGVATAFYSSNGIFKHPSIYISPTPQPIALGYNPDSRLGPVCLTMTSGLSPECYTDRIRTGHATVGVQQGLVEPVTLGSSITSGGPRADVACILLYEGIHDAATRTRVWDYIYRRWGVARPIPKANDGPIAWDTVILAGQSNALGNALLTDLTAPYNAPFSGAMQFNVTPQHWISRRWADLGPVYSADGYGYSCEVSMMRDLAADPSWPNPALLKVAQGSTGLADFWNPAGPGQGWSMLMDAWDRALAVLPNVGDSLGVRAVVWIQGETDTVVQAHALAYEANLTAFIAAVRAKWGASLPFWIVRLTTPSPFGAYEDVVIAAQNAVAAADPLTYIIAPTAPLPDGVHYSASALVQLGHNLAASIIAEGA